MKLVSELTKPRMLGIVLILVALVISGALWSLTVRLNEELHRNCPIPDQYCPFKTSYPIQSYVGFTGVIGLVLLSAYFMTSSKTEKTAEQSRRKVAQQVNSLQGEEKNIYKMIADADGSMFQNDLVRKTGFSKVRVSRILDRLETKGIVERRRRGMSNVVVVR